MGWIVLFVGFSGGGVDDVCVLGSDGLGLMVADFTGGLTEAVGAGVNIEGYFSPPVLSLPVFRPAG